MGQECKGFFPPSVGFCGRLTREQHMALNFTQHTNLGLDLLKHGCKDLGECLHRFWEYFMAHLGTLNLPQILAKMYKNWIFIKHKSYKIS